MLSKALGYLDASQRLINTKNDGMMSSSVAFSYYAVLLYMKFVLSATSKNPISYEIQVWPEEDMHKRILQEIENRITDGRKGKSFKNRVTELHTKRVEADYEERIFTTDEAIDCREEACALISLLKNMFGNLEP